MGCGGYLFVLQFDGALMISEAFDDLIHDVDARRGSKRITDAGSDSPFENAEKI